VVQLHRYLHVLGQLIYVVETIGLHYLVASPSIFAHRASTLQSRPLNFAIALYLLLDDRLPKKSSVTLAARRGTE